MANTFRVFHSDDGRFILYRNNTLVKEVNGYISHLQKYGNSRGRRLATSSIRQYIYYLKEFFERIECERKHLDSFRVEDLISLRNKMDTEKNANTRNVINTKVDVWSAFLNWYFKIQDQAYSIGKLQRNNNVVNYNSPPLFGERKRNTNPPSFKITRLPNQYQSFFQANKSLNGETADKVLEALSNIDVMYWAVAYFMIKTGMRIGDAIQLNIIDSMSEYNGDGYIYYYYAKGNRDRHGGKKEAFVSKHVWEEILRRTALERDKRAKQYKRIYKKDNADFFLRASGESINEEDVWRAIRKVRQELKLPHLVAHCFRNTYACNIISSAIEKNMSDEEVNLVLFSLSKQLGHKHFFTTLDFYLKDKTREMFLNLVKSIDPVKELRKTLPSCK